MPWLLCDKYRRPRTPKNLLFVTAVAIGLGTTAAQAAQGLAVPLAALAGALGLLLWLVPKRPIVQRLALCAPPYLMLIAFAAGLLNGYSAGPRTGPAVLELDERARVVAKIRDVQHLHWGSRALVEITSVNGSPARFLARLTLLQGASSLRRGDLVTGIASMRAPDEPRNPGEMDLKAGLDRRGVQAIGTLSSVSRLKSGPRGKARRIDVLRSSVREAAERTSDRVEELLPGAGAKDVAGILRALSLGESSSVPPEVRESFSTAGLAHLLAISGLHIGLVATGLFALLRFALIRLPSGRMAGPVAALLVAPVCGLLVDWVGHPPSAARAGLMAIVLLMAAALRRRLCPWSSLAVAAVTLLLVEPSLTQRPGFQLSFAAVAGILLMLRRQPSNALMERRSRLRGVSWLATSGQVTLAAAIATAPLCALHFGVVPLVGNVANLVAVPLTGLLLPLIAVAGASTALFGEVADPVWLPAAMGSGLLLYTAKVASSLPLASFHAPDPGAIALILSATGVLATVLQRTPARRFAAALFVVIPLATSSALDSGSPPGKPLEVVVLYVGHGDSVLIRTKAGDILIDSGTGPGHGIDAGKRYVLPALRALGVRRLIAVIVTHPHEDHYGGFVSLLQSMPVDRFYHSGLGAGTGGGYDGLLEVAKSSGADILIACRDPLPDIAPARIECLHPIGGYQSGSYLAALSANENSVVVRVELDEVSFLLTGDIEGEAERLLLESGARLDATVVKAPHHGSATSSSEGLMLASRPRHVVFSSGRPGGRFDFPSSAVVARWIESGAKPWWTYHHGAVHFATDGKELTVGPFREHASSWPLATAP